MQVAPEGVAAALQVGKGALVQSVDPASNAGKAGLLGTRRTFTGIAAGKGTTPGCLRARQCQRGLPETRRASNPFHRARPAQHTDLPSEAHGLGLQVM